MQTEWYHQSHDSQLTQLITTLLRELIRQLAVERGVFHRYQCHPQDQFDFGADIAFR